MRGFHLGCAIVLIKTTLAKSSQVSLRIATFAKISLSSSLVFFFGEIIYIKSLIFFLEGF
jgi:hypothetical protein